MRPGRAVRERFLKFSLKHAISAALVLITGVCSAQTTTTPQDPFSPEMSKYPGLMPEFGKLIGRFKNEIKFPPDRTQSRIMPVLPDSTTYYVAYPNYGDAAHQAVGIFHEELKESAVLRDWWQHTVKSEDDSKFEDAIEKFYELSQYLGDEIVVSGDSVGAKNSFVTLAAVRKSGLKSFLQKLLEQWPGTTKPIVRVLDPQELVQIKNRADVQAPIILVRPDFIVAGPNLDGLKAFNSFLDEKSSKLTSTAFGQRVAQAYQGGTAVLIAADLQKLLHQIPGDPVQTKDMLNRAGFDNVKFLVWEHKNGSGQASSDAELSFNGPRHGVASWLAAPTVLGSLDFVSPKAVAVTSVKLKNLAEIFDGVRELATVMNPNAFASLDQMQQMMNVNLRNDLLNYLDGEITLELDGVVGQQPSWKAILQVNNPERLQQTLSKLFAASGQQPTRSSDKNGQKYYNVVIPSARTPMQITYAYADGYLIIASSSELAKESIQAHRSGSSFAKSPKFLASESQGRSDQASVLLYYDPVSLWGIRTQSTSPEMGQLLAQVQTNPMLVRTYADQDAIRIVSNSAGADPTAILLVAAIAIPNVLRARTSANEAAAVSTMRNIVTAQVTYSAMYPQKGYARDLGSLGGDARGTNESSPEHGGLIDWTRGDASCYAGTWCIKSGYRFSLDSRCPKAKCEEFTALATPLSTNTGVRSFCTTSDGVIRFSFATPSTPTLTSAECHRWAPLQ